MYGDDVSAGPAPLDALDNPAFAEVASILRHLPELDALDDNKRAGLLHEIFGVACDPAPNGSRWRIGFPPCPACGTRKVATWSAASR